jgi:hypothetical protein
MDIDDFSCFSSAWFSRHFHAIFSLELLGRPSGHDCVRHKLWYGRGCMREACFCLVYVRSLRRTALPYEGISDDLGQFLRD